jgi:hypothetical protein
MHAGKPAQFDFAGAREAHAYLPAVAIAGAFARYQAAFFEAIDETHGAVMADEKVLGQAANGGLARFVKGFDGQHHLMLLRFQSFDAGGLFAEVQKLSNLIAKVGQRPVIGGG